MIRPLLKMHHLTVIRTPTIWGLPADTPESGVLRTADPVTGSKMTLVIDFDYAQMLLIGMEELDDMPVVPATAVRWARHGWPEDWGQPHAPGEWQRISVGGGANV